MADRTAVIVADPDEENRHRMAGIVEGVARSLELKLDVHEAADGPAVEELMEEVDPVLLVTEVLLDGRSGLELLRKLRRAESGTTAGAGLDSRRMWVFVTHLNHEADKYWALRNGADAYLMRPYEDESLRARLTKLLKGEAGGRERLT